jgi:hypothetical protein
LEARVTLDLARPEHREALRWACGVNEPIDMSTVVTALQAWCMRAIHQPAASAAIVRALLEGCGATLYVDAIHAGDDWWLDVYSNDRIDVDPIPDDRIPALVLALLACTECRGVKVNGKRYGCRRGEPRIGDTPACPACDDTGIARTTEARASALAALREAGR